MFHRAFLSSIMDKIHVLVFYPLLNRNIVLNSIIIKICRSFKKQIKNPDFLKIQAARMENSV
jgi:hypothetical protein